MKFLYTLLLVNIAFVSLPCFSQTNTYILNGSATQNSCNCYTLTQPIQTQSGSVWNANKINLGFPFEYNFSVYLGCLDATGADGMVFMLQPISTGLGSSGGGMGFQGVIPSIGIALDTWQNGEFNDPTYDHISIQANGEVHHNFDLAGPVPASSTGVNIEDCQWHQFRISWDPATRWLRAFFDGALRVEKQIDLIGTIFNNDPMVYWGFSAATGGSVNLQQFCTALIPEFNTDLHSNSACIGTPVTFTNESTSFGPIQSYYWDFGDGTTSTLIDPPTHLYATPGTYEAKLVITGLDGCISDTFRTPINIGAFPVADFEVYDTCKNNFPRIIDESTSEFGPINQWKWTLDGVQVSTSQTPLLANLDAGTHRLQLQVQTSIGCASQIFTNDFYINRGPMLEMLSENGCWNEPVQLQGRQLDNSTFLTEWHWLFPDGSTSQQQLVNKSFSSVGPQEIKLWALASNGCKSDEIVKTIFISRAYAFAGNDTTVMKDQPFLLQGGGGGVYQWSPPIGLNNTDIQNPTAILQDDTEYILTVTNAEGCVGRDTVKVEVFKGSAIYVPTAFTPNNDGLNDVLKPLYVGIKKIHYFNIFNRWGQKVFSTTDPRKGWDGRLNGAAQSTGTFVWMISAEDHVGKPYQLRGTVTIVK